MTIDAIFYPRYVFPMETADDSVEIRRVCAAYRAVAAERKAVIANAVKAGMLMRKVAEAADIDPAYVRKIARDAGIEPRAPGRRPREAL